MQINDINENTELADVVKLFYGDDAQKSSGIRMNGDGDAYCVMIADKCYNYNYDAPYYDIIPTAHRVGRLSKIALYDALSAHTGKTMPWGALTGVRPSKLFYEALRSEKSEDRAYEIMRKVYRISEKRADILRQIVYSQRGKINYPSEFVNLYVHIPYCTTRCTYCSFVSAPIYKNREQATRYVELLCDEIKQTLDFLYQHVKKILSIYIGGGTPTALDEENFDKLLSAIGSHDCEYTCEAGRPDTVTERKTEIMKAHGVTRVCVNPQTLNDSTLAVIGRGHTVSEFYKVYENVKKFGFDINCDLIAGLGNETVDDFSHSLNGILKLAPKNITVHSLSKKNGSALRYTEGENAQVSAMLDYAFDNINGYRPYYLYRQKRQAGNLENVGFSVPGGECINNITTMEETVSVYACGAGAISKIIDNGNISRFANMRDVPLYISRYDERLKAKLDYFCAPFK